jgi:hypothetical protein
MNTEEHAVILFHSTSHALRAEKVLLKAEIQNKLIPVPRQLSSDCGVCLRIARADRPAAEHALASANVGIESIHNL